METLYKYSQFNVIIEQSEKEVLLYNTYSCNYRVLPIYDFNDIYNKTCVDLMDVPEYLYHEGFLVPNTLDEIQRLKDEAHQELDDDNILFLSIFVTLACNYRCLYCFEQAHLDNTDYMTTETADDIVDFVIERCKNNKITRSVIIKWFGGEPLLNMPIIEYITNKLRSNHIKIKARMFTNGLLLTKETALRLKELDVTGRVVIPLDGLPQTYAKLKQCTEQDFHTVIKNIQDVQDILDIEIHLNTTETNKNEITELYRLLREEYHIHSEINITKVLPQNTDIIDSSNSVGWEDINTIHTKLHIPNLYRRTIAGCEARYKGYYVIGTKGELYICEHRIGEHQYSVGNVKDTSSINRQGTIWDIDKIIDDCSNCIMLPQCLGWCTSNRYIDKLDCNKDTKIEYLKSNIKQLSMQNQ